MKRFHSELGQCWVNLAEFLAAYDACGEVRVFNGRFDENPVARRRGARLLGIEPKEASKVAEDIEQVPSRVNSALDTRGTPVHSLSRRGAGSVEVSLAGH